MIVPKINNNGVFEPDLSQVRGEVLGFTLNPDGETYTVQIKDDGSRERALLATSQLIVAERLLDERLPTERIDDFKAVFDYPVVGRTYRLDWVLKCPTTDELFRVAQPEITFERTWNDFTKFPALFAPFRNPNAIEPWVKPDSTNPYPKGAKVTHKGHTWESMVANNVWEPGAPGIGENIWKKVQ